MTHLFIQGSKYFMIFLMLLYTYECFHIFKFADKNKKQNHIYAFQRKIIFLIHADGFLVLFLQNPEKQMIGFYLMQLFLFLAMFLVYRLFYKNASNLVLNNMVMLLTISMIELTRLSFNKAFRQFVFILAGFVISIIIPLILREVSIFRKFTWLYAAVGIVSLAIVMIFGKSTYGAKISISIGSIKIQPSEFIKILFVFYIASMLYLDNSFKQLVITSIVSAVFVLILVASKDLGGALLYFFTYLVMVYVATRKLLIFVGGLSFLSIGGLIGYTLFTHVQTRFMAWRDPLSVIDNQGYQICQSLFAIGTGGWSGLGLGQGLPKKIPVVENDFIFSAISEEMGGVFALCIIMVCVSCFLMIFNVSMQMKDQFYKLVALGLGSTYALQVFLTIGGVTKFIPSTGVTLPLVSNGGSSLLSTMILFGIVQALYIMQDKSKSEKNTNKIKGGSNAVERQEI